MTRGIQISLIDQPRAIFSRCGRYRYLLWRDIAPDVPGAPKAGLLFVMLNPSTAELRLLEQ